MTLPAVQLTCSRYVGIIMTPVADCNLKAIMTTHPLPPETHSRVRTFYGCLASALRYLHENRLRHKDIKPEVGAFV
jgi:serine/threonine protein kinase